LSFIREQEETTDSWRAELSILSILSPALMGVYGWSAAEVGHAVERAADVGRRLESSADLAPSIAISNTAKAFRIAQALVVMPQAPFVTLRQTPRGFGNVSTTNGNARERKRRGVMSGS
jgi:hypothetical protein